MSSENQTEIKCLIVGDGAVGKTCMLQTYTNNQFPRFYIPTVYDNTSLLFNINERVFLLNLFDTAGQEDFDQLRILSYPSTDVFIICYSISNPNSLKNIEEKWILEIKQHCPKAKYILVGTKLDLRVFDYKGLRDKNIIYEEEGKNMAKKIGADAYVECSAKKQMNLKEIFEKAIMAAISQDQENKKKRPSICACS